MWDQMQDSLGLEWDFIALHLCLNAVLCVVE